MLAFLRTHQAVDPDRVLVLGHSTGAVVAARLPADGFVLLACAAQPGVRVMEWQSEQSAAGMRWPMRPWWMWRQARARASTVDRKGQLVPGRWLRGYMMDDPRPALAAIDRPVDPGLLESIAEWVRST